MGPLLILSTFVSLCLAQIQPAQKTENCPLLGPVFPAPTELKSSSAVKAAIQTFPKLLEQALGAGLLDNETTSFSVNIFSANDTLFETHFAAPGLNGSLAAGTLNNQTVYRVGSLSKLWSMYTFLLSAPGNQLDQPITKFIPELVNASSENLGDGVEWEDITIRSLAGHLSGLGRDYGNYDLANEAVNLTALGFPALTQATEPACGQGFTTIDIRECTRANFIQGIVSRRSVTAPFNTPVYSNFAYIFIGYAIEAITGKSFFDSFEDVVGKPLGLKRTSLTPPTDNNTIIPGNPETNSWLVDAGDENPTGGFFSSLADVTAVAQSILNSDLLRPVVTRSWMKPLTHTSNLRNAVGAPWEIFRQEIPISNNTAANNTRVVDIYAKSGDLGGSEHYYGTLTALDMDHHFGFNILATGKKAGAVRWILGSIISEVWVNALEQAAREEADVKLAGTYESTAAGPASNITFTLDDNRPGLGVSEWYNNGVNMIASLRAIEGIPTAANVSLRLYPLNKFGDELVFRSVIEALPQTYVTGPMATNCITWPTVDSLFYGGAGFDEFAFKVEKGVATAVTPAALRNTLVKQK